MIEISQNLHEYNKTQGIYAIVNTACPSEYCPFGKVYIGQASIGKKHGLGTRIRSHLLSGKKDKCPRWANQHLWRAWKKYGESNFKFFLVEEVVKSSDLTIRENYWINIFQSNKDKFGYNKRVAADSNNGSIFKRITLRTIVKLIKQYKEQTGNYPTQRSGQINKSDNWKAIDIALRCGGRGLPVLGGLSKFIAAKFNIITNAVKPPLTPKNLKLMVMYHYKKINSWPNQFSGKVLLASTLSYESSLTWNGIYQSIRCQLRNWPIKNDTLSLFLARECGVINHTNRPKITNKLLQNLIKKYKEKTGKWPNTSSGWIDELGMTWDALNHELMNLINVSLAVFRRTNI